MSFNGFGLAIRTVRSVLDGVGVNYFGRDLTPPVVTVTVPTVGSSISGTTTITATATDNVGVVGVQFKVDGVSVGAEDASAPYSVAWDSSGSTDGAHTITAVARDAAGNSTTSTGVTVTTSNGVSGGGMASAVAENGIAANLATLYKVGQYICGSWWIQENTLGGGVQVTVLTPDQASGLIDSGTTGLVGSAYSGNGWMINPTGGGSNPYDSRAGGYNATTQLTLPQTIIPPSGGCKSLIKVASLTQASGGSSQANWTFLDKAVVFTIVAKDYTPAPNEFRPNYFGPIKRTGLLLPDDATLTSLLPSKPPPAGNSGPSLSNVEARFRQVQLDQSYAIVNGRPNPAQSFHAYGNNAPPWTPHVYGENLAIDNGEAILRVALNDSLAAKKNSVIYLIQAGIDWYGIAKNGTVVASAGGGGHMGGRKVMATFAGYMLGDSDIQTIAGTNAKWGETTQVYWSSVAGGTRSHFTGQPAGMALFGWTAGAGAFPSTGVSGAKDRYDPSQFVDGCLQVTGGTVPSETGANYTGWGYINIATTHMLLVSTICSVYGSTFRSIFNYDPEIFYADRITGHGWWTVPDGSPTRDLGAPVRALHGTNPGGQLNASYQSAFGAAMRTTYWTTTFTGP